MDIIKYYYNLFPWNKFKQEFFPILCLVTIRVWMWFYIPGYNLNYVLGIPLKIFEIITIISIFSFADRFISKLVIPSDFIVLNRIILSIWAVIFNSAFIYLWKTGFYLRNYHMDDIQVGIFYITSVMFLALFFRATNRSPESE